jgi:exosortase/archaeosortase family protein
MINPSGEEMPPVRTADDRPQPHMPGTRRWRAPRGRHAALRLPFTSGGRMAAAAVLGLVVLVLVLFEYQFRHLEADGAAGIYGLVTPVLVATRAPIIWFGLGTSGAFGLVITPDCSSALLVAPLCGLGMVLMIPRKLAPRRVVKGLSVAAIVLVAGNLTRIGVIALAIRLAGIGTGYQVGHLVLGSLISIFCIAVSLALLAAIITARDGEGLLGPVLRWHRRAAL